MHTTHKIRNTSSGFTIVELLVDIAILAVLVLIVVLLIDPAKQFARANNTRKIQDSASLKDALELYYHDHECFPEEVPFDEEWKEGTVVYMTKVPQSPDCGKEGGRCYAYTTDNSSCPQWYVVFSRLTPFSSEEQTAKCPLQASCLPQNYIESGMNYCVYGGGIKCDALSNATLPETDPNVTPAPTTIPTPTVIPTATAIPTPTVTPIPTAVPTVTPIPTNIPTPVPTTSCTQYFACRGNPPLCNSISTPESGETVYCNPQCDGVCN